MFEVSEVVTAAVDRLYEACASLGRGDCLMYRDIEAIVGCERYTYHWNTCIKKLRRRLRDQRGIAVRPACGIGYRLCEKDEQLGLGHERTIRARRQVRRGIAEVQSLPNRELSFHQKRMKLAQLQVLRNADKGLAERLRSQSAIGKPTEVWPLWRPGMAKKECPPA